MKNNIMYYNGLIIVCKKYYRHKEFTLNVNFKYVIKRYGNFNIDEKNIIQQKNHLKKIKLTNEEIDYIVISNVNNLNIEHSVIQAKKTIKDSWNNARLEPWVIRVKKSEKDNHNNPI